MMQTTETKKGSEERPQDRRRRWPIGLAAVLGVAVVAMALSMLWPSMTTSRLEGWLDDVMASWINGNGAAVRDLYTSDAAVWMSGATQPVAQGLEEIVAEVGYSAQSGMLIERIGAVDETEDHGLIWAPIQVSNNVDVAGADAVAVFHMRDGLIQEHWVIWGS